jgi:hypothetical protein
MAHFNEENTVEQMVLDTLCGGVTSNMVAEEHENYHPQITQINADENPKIICANLRNLRIQKDGSTL